MTDPRYPYHAISNYDAFGDIPFVSRLPREEEDFRTPDAARRWLAHRGGGRIERYAERGTWLYSRETVAPLTETALRC
jgi:hypothetical protein